MPRFANAVKIESILVPESNLFRVVRHTRVCVGAVVFGVFIVAATGLFAAAHATKTPPPSPPAMPTVLPELIVRDLEAKGRLFDRGIPVGADAVSPDGYHLAYLHQVSGGFPRRKPERCAFLLDLGVLENRAARTPKGRANRVAGWDSTGRYLLIETAGPHLLSPFTGDWTTYHWIFDVVTSQFVTRKPFTGVREGERFRWKKEGAVHGVWNDDGTTTVVALRPGELAERMQQREREFEEETARRVHEAEFLGVGASEGSIRALAADLARLDEHWTRRGQKDSIVSDLFGERPNLYAKKDSVWVLLFREIEYVAVLDRGLALVTLEGGKQELFNRKKWETAPLPPPPPEFTSLLATRWDRAGEFYDDSDPLPRDLQYRRATDPTQGIAGYYNFVPEGLRHALLLYSIDAQDRVLRVVDLPETWATKPESSSSAAPGP